MSFARTTSPSTDTATDQVDKDIAAAPYYHGLLPREDMKTMLLANGDFVVRTTEPNKGEKRTCVLSVMLDERKDEHGIKHFIIKHVGEKYVIHEYGFKTITELVEYYLKTGQSVGKSANAIIRKPIPRQPWELSHEDVKCTKKLGEGAFGEVCMGTYHMKNGHTVKVAVKTAKLEALTKEQIKEIMAEARLMRSFDHPNVVKFYGVAAGQEPLLLVMELADKGALDSYLQKNNVSMEQKVDMCAGAAFGIEYMHVKNVLHRDIAARNCLYGDGRVKISDFGLTREGTVYQMDPHSRVPIRWLAPETLRTAIYTQKTDVWSYGILCWEILNNGTEPYPGMTVAEVNGKVKEGYRMALPPGTSPLMLDIIEKHCWQDSPNDRWDMKEVARHFERNGHPRPEIATKTGKAQKKTK
ncbi:kinase domain-containing protein [Aphelenchoides avenae]|nr:kinase domain-containing protein [Aphelenchus avenae]